MHFTAYARCEYAEWQLLSDLCGIESQVLHNMGHPLLIIPLY